MSWLTHLILWTGVSGVALGWGLSALLRPRPKSAPQPPTASTGYGNNMFNATGTYGANMGNAYGNTFNALAGTNSAFGADAANAYANQGNASAAGYMGMSNALMGGVQNGLGLWNYNNNLQQPAGQPPAAANSWAMPPTYFGGGR